MVCVCVCVVCVCWLVSQSVSHGRLDPAHSLSLTHSLARSPTHSTRINLSLLSVCCLLFSLRSNIAVVVDRGESWRVREREVGLALDATISPLCPVFVSRRRRETREALPASGLGGVVCLSSVWVLVVLVSVLAEDFSRLSNSHSKLLFSVGIGSRVSP